MICLRSKWYFWSRRKHPWSIIMHSTNSRRICPGLSHIRVPMNVSVGHSQLKLWILGDLTISISTSSYTVPIWSDVTVVSHGAKYGNDSHVTACHFDLKWFLVLKNITKWYKIHPTVKRLLRPLKCSLEKTNMTCNQQSLSYPVPGWFPKPRRRRFLSFLRHLPRLDLRQI